MYGQEFALQYHSKARNTFKNVFLTQLPVGLVRWRWSLFVRAPFPTPLNYLSVCVSCPVVSNSLPPHGLYVARQAPLSWNSPGKNTGVDSHSLFQGIFWTQGWNPVSCIGGRVFAIWVTRGYVRASPTSSSSNLCGCLVLGPWLQPQRFSQSFLNQCCLWEQVFCLLLGSSGLDGYSGTIQQFLIFFFFLLHETIFADPGVQD